MAKTIASVCTSPYFHRKEDRYVKPGDDVVHHDEEDFARLKNSGCVKEAPAEISKKAEAKADTDTGAKEPEKKAESNASKKQESAAASKKEGKAA